MYDETFEQTSIFNTHEKKLRIDELFLEKVKEGVVEDVRALFQFSHVNTSFQFDRNVVDSEEKSALTIAILQKNLVMCKLLLDNKVWMTL